MTPVIWDAAQGILFGLVIGHFCGSCVSAFTKSSIGAQRFLGVWAIITVLLALAMIIGVNEKCARGMHWGGIIYAQGKWHSVCLVEGN